MSQAIKNFVSSLINSSCGVETDLVHSDNQQALLLLMLRYLV